MCSKDKVMMSSQVFPVELDCDKWVSDKIAAMLGTLHGIKVTVSSNIDEKQKE